MQPRTYAFPDSSGAARLVAFGMGLFYLGMGLFRYWWATRDDIYFPSHSAIFLIFRDDIISPAIPTADKHHDGQILTATVTVGSRSNLDTSPHL
jgi:hypothetical protein